MRVAILTAFLLLLDGIVVRSEFNFEVGRRVHERVSAFMGTPIAILRQLDGFRANGGLTLAAPDRDAFLRLNYASLAAFPQLDGIYYGTEDGMFTGHFRGQWFGCKIAWYREPGHSGYAIAAGEGREAAEDPAMEKHYLACVNPLGESVPCQMTPGGKYTRCNALATKAEGGAAPIFDCELKRCADEASQTNCENENWAECQKHIKWCSSYVIEEAPNNMTLGYVARSAHCTNSAGVPTQTQGDVGIEEDKGGGNCYYEDGVTFVDRQLGGDFAYCGGDGKVCNNTFVGALFSSNYDPRWREWYIDTKRKQKPNYSPPYPFFDKLELGITYSVPIYIMQDDGLNVFAGVLAVDYTFNDIANFLQNSFQNSEFVVVIFEQTEPNYYMVASSTGGSTAKVVLADDESKPCPNPQSKEAKDICKVVRVKASEYSNVDVTAAFFSQREAGFPETELVATKTKDEKILYATQSKPFSIEDAGLDWIIMIMTPVETLPQDTLALGNGLAAIITLAVFGFLFCSALVGLLMRNRKEREVIHSDWRFMSAFVGGAALLNISCLSFLGENTDALCLTRMWLIHFFFVFTLSFLFVKTHRIWMLTGRGATRAAISHAQTARMTLPLIGLQTLILLIFTFVDPYKRTEVITTEGSLITHQYVCAHNTPSFFVLMMVYEGGLIIVGCILAFKTRHLDDEFNESKQIILAMYDTAVIGSVGLVVEKTATTYQGEQRIILTLCIFWTSCFASLVFVLPRLLQVRNRRLTGNGRNSRVRVSGLNLNRTPDYMGYNMREAAVAHVDDPKRAPETFNKNELDKEIAVPNDCDERAIVKKGFGEETLAVKGSDEGHLYRRRSSMESC